MTDRRAFGRLLSGALLAAGSPSFALLSACKAEPKTYRIGFINVGPAGPNKPNVAAFGEALRELGYVEGRNLTIDYFWGDQQVERLPTLIAEMLARRPDLILSGGGPPTIRAVKGAVTDRPVVFITGDPVEEGIVSSLARPGGNLTGFSVFVTNMEGKRIEQLREAFPKARNIAILWNPATPRARVQREDANAAASQLGFNVDWHEARNDVELERALDAIALRKLDALIVLSDPVLGFRRRRIVEFANGNRLPGVYFWREFVQDGGLMSYGPNLTDIYRRAARYADKILKGAKPADLPVEQPAVFELVVNLNTAEALGVKLPRDLLTRAEVVQ